jgi:hypothetical protein
MHLGQTFLAALRRPTLLATLLILASTTAAQQPLLAPVASPPAAVLAWDAAERARNPMILRSTAVQVDAAALAAVRVGGPPPLATFAIDHFGTSTTVDVTGCEWSAGHRVLRGAVAGGGGDFVLVVAPDGTCSGQLDFGGRAFGIAPTPVAGVHVLQELDLTLLPAPESCGVDAAHAVAAPGGAGLPEAPNSDCSLLTIDLMVCYTPLARQNAGGTAAIEAVLVGAVAQANTGHRASGAPVEFRLVHLHETSYVETGTSTDLSRFRGTSDGYMDEVHALRDAYGADLMHLVIDPPSASFCGIAYLKTTLSTGFASSAFAVTVRSCIPNHTFTHECGHNMGCHHDAANAGAAIYPYSYGYRTPDNAWRTIMAYAPGTRVNRWSSPSVVWQGYAMGIDNAADNVRSIGDTAATVAQFRATQTLRWCDLDGGIPGALGEPVLEGRGTVNQIVPVELRIRDYAPGAVGVLIVGAAELAAPMFGGILMPAPDVLLTIVPTGPEFVHGAAWLLNLGPGFQAWFQAAFLDAAAIEGLSASDGVRVTVP